MCTGSQRRSGDLERVQAWTIPRSIRPHLQDVVLPRLLPSTLLALRHHVALSIVDVSAALRRIRAHAK
jgi:hypothetical protein